MSPSLATHFLSGLLWVVASGAALGCSCASTSTAPDASDGATGDAPAPLDAPSPLDAPRPLDAPTSADAPADTVTSDAGGCAPGSTSTDLPSLSVAFPSQRCVYTLAEAAAGISFEYAVNVAAPVTIEQMLNCETPGPSGAVVDEAVDGGGEHYCVCDTGRCPPSTITPALGPGAYPDTLAWTGRNWSGPSDTGMPLGPPFPAGDYVFEVGITGTSGGTAFTARGTLPFRLVP